jgi:rRNA maturation protein Nop10
VAGVTAEPTCPACGALCWVDGVQYVCRDCGGAGRLVEPALSPRERYAARRRLDERAETRR